MEHEPLVDAATAVLQDLRTLRGRYRYGRVANMQHDEFAERAISLEIYLASALRLCRDDHYLAAFALLRAALEHHLVDRLLFTARVYKRQFTGVKKAEYERLRSAWENKEPGTETIVRLERNGGNVVIVWTGPYVVDDAGRKRQTLSIYYSLLQQFDPFIGRPSEQAHLARGFMEVEQQVELAEEQRQLYRQLQWEEIKNNLRENRICGIEALRRFEVHYRFLSAFVHPMPKAYDLVYGHNRPTGAPRHDHFACELGLLYINKIAATELKYIKRMSSRPPRIRLGDWPTVEAHIRRADAVASHLWFPGDAPHDFDFVEEANSRGMRKRRLVPRDKRPKPSDLTPQQVRYYRNPLDRLIKMHQSFHEMTGFSYESPWPHPDVQRRA